jgi:hypothetical protein
LTEKNGLQLQLTILKAFSVRRSALSFLHLHDLLANHKDAQTSASLSEQQIAASGYHCHIDDLVVVAPFLPDIQTTEPILLSSAALIFSEPVASFAFSCGSNTDSRGPPAIFCA